MCRNAYPDHLYSGSAKPGARHDQMCPQQYIVQSTYVYTFSSNSSKAFIVCKGGPNIHLYHLSTLSCPLVSGYGLSDSCCSWQGNGTLKGKVTYIHVFMHVRAGVMNEIIHQVFGPTLRLGIEREAFSDFVPCRVELVLSEVGDLVCREVILDGDCCQFSVAAKLHCTAIIC